MLLTLDICTRLTSVLPSLCSLSGHRALAVLDSQIQGERHLGFPNLHNSSFQIFNTGSLCTGFNRDSKHKSFQKSLSPRVHARD